MAGFLYPCSSLGHISEPTLLLPRCRHWRFDTMSFFSCLYNDDALTDSLFSINTNLIHHGTTLMALHTMAQRNLSGSGMHALGRANGVGYMG